jgi:hypothetical protein
MNTQQGSGICQVAALDWEAQGKPQRVWRYMPNRAYAGIMLGGGVSLAYLLISGRRHQSLRKLARQALVQEYPQYARIFAASELRVRPADVFVRVGDWTRAIVSEWRASSYERLSVFVKRTSALVLALCLAFGSVVRRPKSNVGLIWWRAILNRVVALWEKVRLGWIAAWCRFLQISKLGLCHVAAITPKKAVHVPCLNDLTRGASSQSRAPTATMFQAGSSKSRSDSVLGFADQPGSACIAVTDDSRAEREVNLDNKKMYIDTATGTMLGASAVSLTEVPYHCVPREPEAAQVNTPSRNNTSGEQITASAAPEPASMSRTAMMAQHADPQGSEISVGSSTVIARESDQSRSPDVSFETQGPSPTRSYADNRGRKDFCCSSNRNRRPKRDISPELVKIKPDEPALDSVEWDPPFAGDLSATLSTSLDHARSGRSEMFGALAARIRSILGECTDPVDAERLGEVATLLQRCASSRPDPEGENRRQSMSATGAVKPIDAIEDLVNIVESMILANATLRAEAAAVRRELAAGLVPSATADVFNEPETSATPSTQALSPMRTPFNPEAEESNVSEDEHPPENADHEQQWPSSGESSTTLSDMENDLLFAEQVTHKLEQQVAVLTRAKGTFAQNCDDDENSNRSPLPAMLVTMNGSLHSIPRSIHRYG